MRTRTININQVLRDNPRSSKYGAPLGARSVLGKPEDPLHVQRVRFVDGDYAPDGTYWGGGRGTEPLWCGFSGTENQVYVRARSRAEALAEILAQHPDAKFLRR